MKFLSNRLVDVRKGFVSELLDKYGESETEHFFYLLLHEYTSISKVDMALNPNNPINETILLAFNSAIRKLKLNMPIQYIIGKTNFCGLEISVTPDVLIPRPETEELVDLISKENEQVSSFMIDIGTGSGCIAIALKKQMPHAVVYASDVSDEALIVARENAIRNEVDVCFMKQDILKTKVFDHVAKFDLVVSNPPYVCESEKKRMKKNVLDYEPHLALFVNDNDPLQFYNAIAEFSMNSLTDDGKLYLEVNERFEKELIALFIDYGFKHVQVKKDINGKPRILIAKLIKH